MISLPRVLQKSSSMFPLVKNHGFARARLVVAGIILLGNTCISADFSTWNDEIRAAAQSEPDTRESKLAEILERLNSAELNSEQQLDLAWKIYWLAQSQPTQEKLLDFSAGIPHPNARMLVFGLRDTPALSKSVAPAVKKQAALMTTLPGVGRDEKNRITFGETPTDNPGAFEKFVEPPAWLGRWAGGGYELDVTAYPQSTVVARVRKQGESPDKDVRMIGSGTPAESELLGGPWKAVWKNDHYVLIGSNEETPLSKQQVGKTGKPAPEGATVLFDGKNFDKWRANASRWKLTPEGWAQATPDCGSLVANEAFGDARIYLEYRHAFNSECVNRARGNSGIYPGGPYEVQLSENFAGDPSDILEGGIYHVAAPRINASAPPMEWQSFEIEYRAPRFDAAGNKTENARMTVWQNDVLIHENVEIPGPTVGSSEPVQPQPLNLQYHAGLLQFRNIWIQPGDFSKN